MTRLCNDQPITEEFQPAIDAVLLALWSSSGLREGWYNAVSEVLRGQQKLTDVSRQNFLNAIQMDSCGFPDFFMSQLEKEATIGPSLPAGQGVIIQFSPNALFHRYGKPVLVVPVPMPRSVKQIIGVPEIDLSDIQSVYAYEPNSITEPTKKVLSNRKIPIMDIDTIPEKYRMNPDMGFRLDVSTLRPDSPLCAVRYNETRMERQEEYARAFRRGELAPLYSITPLDINGYRNAMQGLGDNIFQQISAKQATLLGVK